MLNNLSQKDYLKSEFINLRVKVTVAHLKCILGYIGLSATGKKDELLSKVIQNSNQILGLSSSLFRELRRELSFTPKHCTPEKLVSLLKRYVVSQRSFVYFSNRNLKLIMTSINCACGTNAKMLTHLRLKSSKISTIPITKWTALQKSLKFKGSKWDLINIIKIHALLFEYPLTDAELIQRTDDLLEAKKAKRKAKKRVEESPNKPSNVVEKFENTIWCIKSNTFASCNTYTYRDYDRKMYKWVCCGSAAKFPEDHTKFVDVKPPVDQICRHDEHIKHNFEDEIWCTKSNIFANRVTYNGNQYKWLCCGESNKYPANHPHVHNVETGNEYLKTKVSDIDKATLKEENRILEEAFRKQLEAQALIKKAEDELKQKLEESRRKIKNLQENEEKARNQDSHTIDNTCCVCMENQVNIVFLKCGHVICCNDCATQLKSCPNCRQSYKPSDVMKIYF